MMSYMGVALDYGREHAPPEVLDCLDWLASEHFTVVAERGGPGESFGNLVLRFEGSALAVRITRDRGQWSLEFAPDHGEFVPLNVLVTAWQGSAPAPAGHTAGTPLPEVLPEGVAWAEVVPGVISWLDSGDRTSEIGAARTAWNAAMTEWWAAKRRRP